MLRKAFTFFLGLICLTTMQAQTESSIDADDIRYWVGDGDNQAILVVDFGTDAYAWGYRFDVEDAPTALNMITAVDAADPRLAFAIDWATYSYNFFYVEYPKKLMTESYRFKVDGTLAEEEDEFSDYDLENGTIVKVSVSSDDVWSTAITPATVKAMPVFSTIAADDIDYWVGTGSKQAIVAVYWSNPDTALAWGYRFDGTKTVADLFADLAAADSRLTTASNSINYVSDGVNLSFQNVDNNYLQFDVEGLTWPGWNSELPDNAFVRVGESLFGEGYDSTYSYGSWYPAGVIWSTRLQPVDDPDAAEEATIDADDILFWVGNGNNQVVLAVNWADTALAWGCRFSTATVSVQDVMDSIATADPRFSYTLNGSFLGDILFVVAEGDTLRSAPGSYWESKRNGVSDAGMAQSLENGDFEKWADPAAGVKVDSMYYEGWGWSYIYVYPMTIYPVSQPTSGINDIETLAVQIYPNPASTQLSVRFDALRHGAEMALYDMTGRKCYTYMLAAGTSQAIVPVSQLANGIYLLRMGENAVKVVVRH